jgi:hypothetical protein
MYVLPLFRYSCKQTLGHCLTRNETSNNSPSGSPSYLIIILNIMVHVIYVLNSLQYGEPDFVFFLCVFRRIAPRLECLLWNPPFFVDPLSVNSLSIRRRPLMKKTHSILVLILVSKRLWNLITIKLPSSLCHNGSFLQYQYKQSYLS